MKDSLEIFNTKAEYNSWLKQLTPDEKQLVLTMMEENASNRLEKLVIRFVGGNEPLNVGKLKKIIADLDDDFTIDMRVRTKLTDEQLKNLSYPYPYNTEYTQLEFDDIGYSDKQLCLGCEIANKHV